MEVWKDVVGFEDYEISNTGRIRTKPKELKPKISKQGLLEISLCKNNKRSGKMLGRLVCEAFLGKELTKDDVVIYLDGDKTNCSFDNLKVISRSERERMAYDIGEKKATKHEFNGEYLTIGQIAEKTGIKLKTLEQRIYRFGWSAYEAVEIPLNVYKRKEDK
jgi:hypothetical protein